MDIETGSALATGAGTLVLAAATFASVRSGNRASRLSERALLAQQQPFLMPSHWEDAEQKVTFVDNRSLRVAGGGGAASVTEDAVLFAISVRNAGSGIAVLDGWEFSAQRRSPQDSHPDPSAFRRLTRDLYIPAGEIGFWQGAFRDPAAAEFAQARSVVEARESFTIDVLYSDHEGGQRVITRFALVPRDPDAWYASATP